MSQPAAVSSATPPRFKAGQRVIVPTKRRRSFGTVLSYGLDERFCKVLKRSRCVWIQQCSLIPFDK